MVTIITRPKKTYRIGEMTVRLWVSNRRLPALLRADGMIVPVAPDLKMVFGVAKLAREHTADAIQREADRVAPLPAGRAFVGPGSRYRYERTALAVIFDDAKRTSPQYIATAVRRAMRLLAQAGARSVIYPDMTENLLAQPNWITEEQRGKTAAMTAHLTADTLAACIGVMPVVNVWVWERANAGPYEVELAALERDWRGRSALVATKEVEAPDPEADVSRVGVSYGRPVTIERTELIVASGEATDIPGDALLFPTSTKPGAEIESLLEKSVTGSLTGAVAREGGAALAAAAKEMGELQVGSAAISRAGEIDCLGHVIYLAERLPKQPATLQSIEECLRVGLAAADQQSLGTVVVPNLGSDENDYPAAPAIALMVSVIADYLHGRVGDSSIRRIVLVARDQFEQEAFDQALDLFRPGPLEPLLALGKQLGH
jgi:O-acetyl-ADP-ribose deacetylase (regulator of RNase III)